jgi:hypothetical protein
MGRRVALTS